MALRDTLIGLRNRLLASPGFQRRAVQLPGGRAIGRARAGRLFDLTAGFVYSQVVKALIETGLLARLASGPLTLEGAAQHCDLSEEATRTLLVAGEGVGLLRWARGNRVMLGAAGAELLANPGAAAMIAHHHLLWQDLADPLAFLRGPPGAGALARFWPYARGTAGEAGPYSALMAASQPLIAAQLLAAHDFRSHRLLMDVGGGEGAFLLAANAAHPHLRLRLFDLPDVAARARHRLADRAEVIGGNFREESLPPGADCITLVRILHDHDDPVAEDLLAKCHAALEPGGSLIVCEPMAGTRGSGGVGAYFAFYLRAMGSGRPRTARELRTMLRASGFHQVREEGTPLPVLARVLVARKPARPPRV
ncbi:MAG: methyltransferase [Sphingomonadaceae bacterium]